MVGHRPDVQLKNPAVDLLWPAEASDALYARVHRVVHAVAADGGAIGWLSPPDETESRRWVDSVLAGVGAGESALCVATVDGVVQGAGCWQRDPAAVFRHRAEVRKIMAHPSARRLGLGRLITQAIIGHTRAAGLETLHLGVRGNNHVAIALYEQLGFRVLGRLPNAIAVGELRFDEVRMYLTFPRPTGVVWRGSQPGGPGGSDVQPP